MQTKQNGTVYQFLFALTLFRDELPINWFAKPYVCDQTLSRRIFIKTIDKGLVCSEKFSL